MPSVIPAMIKVIRAHPKFLLMMKMTKKGIIRTLVRVRILGRFMVE
jgi:hypothetical protein